MIFEPETGYLRYIRLNGREVLRGVYAAVRDRAWATIAPHTSVAELQRDRDSFRLRVDVEHTEGEIDFAWRGTISGDPDGTVTFEFDGHARSSFLRNRIGFCVLHPVRECAGQPCTLELADGTRVEARFPSDISPHQPFRELRAIRHEVAPGVSAEVRFEGEVFETEDQRNWTDASFKTYCTPLSLPFPVAIDEGDAIRQRVTLTLHGAVTGGGSGSARSTGVEIAFAPGATMPLPPLGLAGAERSLSDGAVERLRALRLGHLRVDLRLSDGGASGRYRSACAASRALDAPLEVAVFLSGDAAADLARIRALIADSTPPVARWLVFHVDEKSTESRWVEMARDVLGGYGAPIGAGTDVYFAELNRKRPPAEKLDFVCYSINPQVHAFDDRSLVETLPIQGDTVRNARRFSADLPIVVTPVTLKPRFNPHLSGAAAHAAGADPRQASLFCAAWTIGSVKHLAEAGAAGITYFETTGPRGIMPAEETLAQGELPSIGAAVFPVYHALAAVGDFAGGVVHRTVSSDSLGVEALALARDGRTRILLANLSGGPELARIANPAPGAQVTRRVLDERNVDAATGEPERFARRPAEPLALVNEKIEVELGPYACVSLDIATRSLGGA